MVEVAAQTAGGSAVLIVDDDPDLQSLIGGFLVDHGLEVINARTAREADAMLAKHDVNVIVLDLMLPGEDGLSYCRRLWGAGGPPILMLTAKGDDTDVIVGLELGADDYLAKPCNPRELLARIRVLQRRACHPGGSSVGGTGFEFLGWRLLVWRHELRAPDDVLVPLSSGEFALIKTFAAHPRRVLSRDQLLDLVRGRESFSYDRAVDVQVSRLRRKLETYQDGAELIRTVRNQGYVFTADVRSL